MPEPQPPKNPTDVGLDARDKKRLTTAAIAAGVAILVILFIAKNNREVRVSFVVFSATTSVIWVIVLSLIAGAILGSIVPRSLRRKFGKDKG